MKKIIKAIPANIDAILIKEPQVEHEFIFGIAGEMLTNKLAQKVIKNDISIIRHPLHELIGQDSKFKTVAILSQYFNHISLRILNDDVRATISPYTEQSPDEGILSMIPVTTREISQSPHSLSDLPKFLVEQTTLLESGELNAEQSEALFNWLALEVPGSQSNLNPFTEVGMRERWSTLMESKSEDWESA